MTWLKFTVKLRPSICFMCLFVWLSFLLLCFIFLSNGSVVPSILIKIDAEAQIDQRQLVAFMNTTLKSGALGKYEVDNSSVQCTGTHSEETIAGHISMARKYCWPVKGQPCCFDVLTRFAWTDSTYYQLLPCDPQLVSSPTESSIYSQR